MEESLDLFWFASQLQTTRLEWKEAVRILEPLIAMSNETHGGVDSERHGGLPVGVAGSQFAMALIGTGEFGRARVILESELKKNPNDIAAAFNFAMAAWGADGFPTREFFERVVLLWGEEARFLDQPNFMQCMAVAMDQTGNPDRALEFLGHARQAIEKQTSPEFTCWRYLLVSPAEFKRDLAELGRSLIGEPVSPPFLDAALSSAYAWPSS
jgi:hypothetical protein